MKEASSTPASVFSTSPPPGVRDIIVGPGAPLPHVPHLTGFAVGGQARLHDEQTDVYGDRVPEGSGGETGG